MSVTAVPSETGVVPAQALFSQTQTTGSFHSAERFIDSWVVPRLLAPSPKNDITTASSPRICAAVAIPTASGA